MPKRETNIFDYIVKLVELLSFLIKLSWDIMWSLKNYSHTAVWYNDYWPLWITFMNLTI